MVLLVYLISNSSAQIAWLWMLRCKWQNDSCHVFDSKRQGDLDNQIKAWHVCNPGSLFHVVHRTM